MVTISVRDKNEVKKALGEFKDQANAVIAKALNKAAQKSQKQLPPVAGEAYSFASDAPETTEARKIVKIKKASEGNLYSSLRYSTGIKGLDHFERYYGAKVYVGVHKGAMKTVKDAFVPRDRFGHYNFKHWRSGELTTVLNSQLIFKREGKDRYPIDRLYSVPVGVMFQHENVVEAFSDISGREYEAALAKHIRLAMKRGNRAKAAAGK